MDALCFANTEKNQAMMRRLKMAKIYFKPICSKCGNQIFSTISYSKDIEKQASYFTSRRMIEPSICPNCGDVFDGIEMPIALPYDNKKQEDW